MIHLPEPARRASKRHATMDASLCVAVVWSPVRRTFLGSGLARQDGECQGDDGRYVLFDRGGIVDPLPGHLSGIWAGDLKHSDTGVPDFL